MCSCLLFWYLIFTICSLLSFFYRIIEYFFFNGMQLGDLATYLQIFALCFFGTLSIQKFSEKKPGQKEEKLIDKKETSILRDHCSKYLFSYAIGCLLITYCTKWIVDSIGGNTSNNNFIVYIDMIYSYIALPCGCVLDLFFTEKRRCPRPVIDLILINCTLILFCAFEYGYQHREKKTTFGVYLKGVWIYLILRFIFSILAYFLYDFLVYLRVKKNGDYYHFLSLDTSKPKEKPKAPKKEDKPKEGESKEVEVKVEGKPVEHVNQVDQELEKTDIKSSDDKVV